MPTYAYRCGRCNQVFEHVETMSEHGTYRPPCPNCGGDDVTPVPAPFVAVTSKKS